MTQISNADKQIRFRKKEQLKRRANNIFREWQLKLSTCKWKSITPQDVQHSLDKAIDLPSGWTDKDYECAEQTLEQLHTDLSFAADQLKNDVDAGWGFEVSMTTSDPVKFISDNKAAIEDTRALAAHLISGLKLSNCNDADQAAALMEALRFVGRSLVSNRDIPRSQATTICLASIGPHYNRPDWFAEQLANTLGQQIDKSLAHQVGMYLSNLNHKDLP
ncbi:hypothetical protein LCGC14_1768040 [marine sediment metagenome]|uniref:Uncharacterized protein n=1 Tax=marine sediment metagenome TaxID=412755 RepID=A0A0F9GZ04_9ZZZZ|nr:hypothetical protein [Candidatus Anoxychlamydiales bacterium]